MFLFYRKNYGSSRTFLRVCVGLLLAYCDFIVVLLWLHCDFGVASLWLGWASALLQDEVGFVEHDEAVFGEVEGFFGGVGQNCGQEIFELGAGQGDFGGFRSEA